MPEQLKLVTLDADSHHATCIAIIDLHHHVERVLQRGTPITIEHASAIEYENTHGRTLFVVLARGILDAPNILTNATIDYYFKNEPDHIHHQHRDHFQFVLYPHDTLSIEDD